MNTSSRRRWLQASAILATGLAFGLRLACAASADGPIARLDLNENFFGPSPRAVSAIRNNMARLERYVDEEAAAFVRQVATYERVAPEQIVVGEILQALGTQLGLHGGAGGEFIYSVPGYPALVNAAARVGGRIIAVPLDAQLGNDLPALAAAITPRTRALFLVNPHNPSGTASGRAEFLEFLRRAAAQSLVIVDEAYLEYLEDFPARTAVNLTRTGANVAVFRTFAKVWGLAGLPLGYLVAPRALADSLRQSGLGSPRDLNRLAVVAASASLRDADHVRQVRIATTRAREKWHAFLDARKIRHTDSQANFVYFDAGRPHAEVARFFAAEGIVIGRAFPPHDTWVRISLGTPEENMRAQVVCARLLR